MSPTVHVARTFYAPEPSFMAKKNPPPLPLRLLIVACSFLLLWASVKFPPPRWLIEGLRNLTGVVVPEAAVDTVAESAENHADEEEGISNVPKGRVRVGQKRSH
jgi:hypothetical protein